MFNFSSGSSIPAALREDSTSFSLRIVGVISVAVAFLGPDRLLGQLLGALEIVRPQFLRGDIVVGLEAGPELALAVDSLASSCRW